MAAEADDSVPDDPVLRALDYEKKQAVLRKEIAEARAAEQKALLPDLPQIEIPEEKLDAGDKASPLSEILAYAELDDAADRLLDRVGIDLGGTGSLRGARVLLVSRVDLERRHGAYLVFTEYRAALATAVEAAIKRLDPDQPEGLGAGVIGLALGALPTVLSLLRSNSTIRSRDFTVAANAVLAAVGQKLYARGAEVIVDGFTHVPQNQIFRDIEELRGERDKLADQETDWRVKRLQAAVRALAIETERLKGLYESRTSALAAGRPTDELDAEIRTVRGEIATHEGEVTLAEGHVDTAKRLITAVDTFLTAAYTTPADGSAPVADAAKWHEFFATDAGGRFVLLVEASFGGGESSYDERVGRDRAQHVGGVTLSYMLTDATGVLRAAGVVSRVGSATHKIGEDSLRRGRSQLLE